MWEKMGGKAGSVRLAGRMILCAVAVLLPAFATGAGAGTYTWNPTSGTNGFAVTTNWTPGGVPGAGDDLYFYNDTGTISLTQPGTDVTSANAYFSGAVSVTGKTAVNTGSSTRAWNITSQLVIDNGSDLWLSGGIIRAGTVVVGNTGVGTFKLRSTSALLDTNSLTVSSGSTLQLGQGTLTTRLSAINSANSFNIGATGTSTDSLTWNMSGTNSITLTTGSVVLGATNVARGIVNVSGTTTTWTTNGSDLYVGNSGGSSSELHITGGAVVTNTSTTRTVTAKVGAANSAANNLAEVSGGGSQWNTMTLIVGDTGSGNQVNVTNGGALSSANVTLGNSSNSSGNIVTVGGNDARWINSGGISLGGAGGNNQLVIAAGGLVATNSLTLGRDTTSSGNILKLTGGTLTVQTLNVQRGSVQFTGGTLNVNASIFGNGSAFVVGDGSNAATLNLLGGAHSFDTGLAISSHASLTGNGAISHGAATIAGTLAIGNSAGTMAFSQGLTFGEQAVGVFEITDPSAGAGTYDLATGSNVTFDGTLQLIFVGGEFITGSSFQLFQFSSYGGNFSQITVSGLGAGQSALFDAATGTVTVAAVPEPASLLTLAGLALLGLHRRRN